MSFEPGTVHAPSGLSNDKYAKLLFAQLILCLKKPQTCSVNIILFLNIIGRYFLIFRCFFAIGKDEVHEFDSRHQLQLKHLCEKRRGVSFLCIVRFLRGYPKVDNSFFVTKR